MSECEIIYCEKTMSRKTQKLGKTMNTNFRPGRISPEALSDLFGAESADPIQPEAEQQTSFLPHTDVVG